MPVVGVAQNAEQNGVVQRALPVLFLRHQVMDFVALPVAWPERSSTSQQAQHQARSRLLA